MVKGKKIAIVIPAHNESVLIRTTLDSLPDFVDRVIVVDDKSSDDTVEVVRREYQEKDPERFCLIEHEVNQGVGGAIVTGYKKAVEESIDVAVVMAGDAQMDPADLPQIIGPVADGEVDYTKGNRLFRGESWDMIPHVRYLGNSCLSLLTKIASGYWHIADSQSGYTAISLLALKSLKLDNIYKRYGMPNDILIKLNIMNFAVRDVSIRPVYNIGEKSGLKIKKVIFTIPLLLIRGFIRRMLEKYVIRDFHPLVFFYILGAILLPIGALFGFYLLCYRIFVGQVSPTSALFASFLLISGLQSFFFGMWFDMEYNKHLR